MNLEGVAAILQRAGVGKPGATLFVNFMPTDKSGILLRDPFGGTPLDAELPGFLHTSFMLIVRDASYVKAKTLAAQAIAALTLEGVNAGGMQVNYMRARHEPLSFQPSPGGLFELVTNIDCCYVLV